MREEHQESAEIIGRAWPDWEIRDIIGTGAFATVYRASRRERIEGEKDSAIKIIRIPRDDSDWNRMLSEGKTPEQAEEFFRGVVDDSLKEIRAMEELSGHTNIVNIFDYKLYQIPEQNVWYILIRMELLQKVDTSNLDEREIIRLGLDVCTALSICRKKNIVHRDVSLDNIFIHDGNYKLGDFGVAKVLEGTIGGLHSIAGKPLYMAPEIYNASLTESDINSMARVDIYSLGILLYRLCHHMNYPFEDPDTPNVPASERSSAFRRRVIDGEELPPPRYASPELAKIILKASMADPGKRYDNVNTMREDLQALNTPQSSPDAARDNKATEQIHSPRKKILTFGAIALAFLLAVAGIWFLTKQTDAPKDSIEKVSETDTGAPGIHTNQYHIILTAREMGIGDFWTTWDMLKERLDILTGGPEGYEFSVNEREGRIDLFIPYDIFAGQDVDSMLRRCLIRPSVLYAMNQKNHNSYLEVGTNDLKSVTLKESGIDGVNPSDYDVESSSVRYMEIVLSDEFVSLHRKEIESWDKLIFALDYEQYQNTTVASLDKIASAGDGKTYYALLVNTDERLDNLLCRNLLSEPLPAAMDYTIDLNYLTEWQKTAGITHPGKNQCDYSDVPDESVSIKYRIYTEMKEGKLLDAEIALKSYMDQLDVPYAFGIFSEGKYSYLTVKIPSCRMAIPVMHAPDSSSLTFRSEMLKADCSLKNLIVESNDDSYGFTLTVPEECTSFIQTLADEAATGDGYLYLCLGQSDAFPLFVADISKIHENRALIVEYYCEIQDNHLAVKPLDADHAWLGSFMQKFVQHANHSSMSGLSCENWQVNTSAGEKIPSAPAFAVNYSVDVKVLEKTITDICPSAFIQAGRIDNSSPSLMVFLSLSADETLPDKYPILAQKIYEAIDFPSLPYSSMNVFPFAIRYPGNTYIFFSKSIRNISNSFAKGGGYIYATGSFMSEAVAPYQEKIVKNIEDMEFYQALTHEDTHWNIRSNQNE